MRRGPRNLRVSLDGVGLTKFGGVTLLHHFFQRIGLRSQLSQAIRFVQRNHRYSVSESIEALLYPLILGLGRIETTKNRQFSRRIQVNRSGDCRWTVGSAYNEARSAWADSRRPGSVSFRM